VEVVVLGAHGTWPLAGGATSGLLVRHDGFSLWLDAGTGTLANLQRHVSLFDVGAMVLSHSHPDHVTDLYPYLFARLFSPEHPAKIPLCVAPGILERVNPLLTDDTGDMQLSDTFDVVEVEPGTERRAGPFRILTAPMTHTVPTIGMRIEADDRTLAYSADTGPCDELVGLARDCDLLIAEASWQEDGEDRLPIHMTAREAGEAAGKAGVNRVALTHIRPYLDRDRSREEAVAAFDGEVLLSTEGLTLEIGR
jgi:ribonuclease BN (tRNA processing enzyme)